MLKNELSAYELDCIRFYMGDPEIVNRGDFRGGPKAYNTINALLHDGIQNEIDKMSEGKRIEIFDAEHLKSYMSLIAAIYVAMQKYSQSHENRHLTTYRVDRFSEIAGLKEKKRIEGFYSTCKWGYLSEYANTKANVVLLEIVREENIPYLDFESLFAKYYAKPQEAEILLPFDAKVKKVEEVPLTEEEKILYQDIHGEPPIGKFKVRLEYNDSLELKKSWTLDAWEDLQHEILSSETIMCVQNCLKHLNECKQLEKEELKFYTDWKQKIKLYIAKMIEERAYAF